MTVESMNGDEVRFGSFRLHLSQRELSRDGTPVRLGSRALEILCVLASAKGDVVTKDDLMARVWPDAVVEENAIQVHISALRKALDEEKSGRSYVVTATGRGYRLIGLQPSAAAVGSEIDARRNLALPDKPSIAVLPFQNLSADPEQEYFADGIVEDIITGLSRIRWLFVIARNSSFIYKGKAVDVKQIGRELGVRYVLEGGVRKPANRIRITAQLVEAETGAHLWAERYDRLLDDIFAVQDEITMSVIGAIEPSLRKAEIERIKRKRPDSLDAYDLVLRSLPFLYSAMPGGVATAIPLLEKALELQPDYARAQADLAWCLHHRFSRGEHHEEDRARAIRYAHAAVAGGGDDATTLAIAAFVISLAGHDNATALNLFDRALALSNSNIFALGCSAVTLAWMGKTEPAIERAQRALRLSPFDPLNVRPCNALAISYFCTKRYDKAADAARRATEFNPGFSPPHALLAAALIRLGRVEEAKAAAQRVLALQPTFTIRRFSVTVGFAPAVYEPFAEAWRAAGLPEE
jgi:TolB-like protein/tetratricopeptide (TPR) repeat protein